MSDQLRTVPQTADRSMLSAPLAMPAAISLAAYGAMVVTHQITGTLRAGTTPLTLGFYAVAFVAYLVAAYRSEQGSRLSWPLLWLAPVLFRLLLVATEPTLSDDVYRYLWDGHVLSNGVNPYRYAIDAAELDQLAIPIRELANNPDLSSPYLPTLQLLFAGLSVVAPSEPIVIQLVMVGFDLAAAVVIHKLLTAAGLPTNRVLLYLWNPLVVVESAHGAHFDSLLVFLALTAVLAAVGPARSITSPVALALATLTRPIPALLAPVLWWRWTWRQRMLFLAVLVVPVVLFGLGRSGFGLVGAPSGTGVFGSARVYGTEFRFNAVVSTWLEDVLPTAEVFTAVTIGLMSVVILGVWWRARPSHSSGPPAPGHAEEPGEVRRLLRLAVVPLVAYVMLTPVLHPWYLVVVVAFGLFIAPGADEPRSRWLLLVPLVYLNAAVVLSYLTYVDPEAFRELDWVRRLVWYPTITLAALAVLAAVRAGGRTRSSPVTGRL